MINYKARMYLSYIAYHYYHNKIFPIREDITRSYRTGRSLRTLIINNYSKPDRLRARGDMFKCYY